MSYSKDDRDNYGTYDFNLLQKYDILVSMENRMVIDYVHEVKVKDIETFKIKTYRIPYRYKEQVKKELQNMINAGIIGNPNTRYINSVVIVKKTNGDLRICLDARNLKKISIPQHEAPMNIDAIFGRITYATIYTRPEAQFLVDTIKGKK